MSRKIIILSAVLACLNLANLYAQESNARIENTDFYIIGDQIMISYDLVGASSQEIFNLSLECVTENNEIIIPVSVEGDIGEGIKPGKGKKIYWDVYKDVEELTGEIEFRVVTVSVERIYGGPVNAAYSVLVPGLGDYYVADPADLKIKPYYRTIAAYMLVGYGVYERINSNRKYDDYKSSRSRDEFDDLYKKANTANHRSYIALGAGIAVWTCDIVWVLVRGTRNSKQNKYRFQGSVDGGLLLGFNEYGLNVKYIIKF